MAIRETGMRVQRDVAEMHHREGGHAPAIAVGAFFPLTVLANLRAFCGCPDDIVVDRISQHLAFTLGTSGVLPAHHSAPLCLPFHTRLRGVTRARPYTRASSLGLDAVVSTKVSEG